MNKIKRVLLKVSGESLVNDGSFGFDDSKINTVAKQIVTLGKSYELLVVCGAGNIWRQRDNSSLGLNRVNSDTIGMMGTLINSTVLSKFVNSLGGDSVVYSTDSINVPELGKNFNVNLINDDLLNKKIVFCAGGTGSPFFTTDTASSLRAAQLNCDVILKATKVDGVYDKDPNKYPDAKRFEKLTFDECIRLNLEIMDQTAFTMCKENGINILVFKNNDSIDFKGILGGDLSKATLIY